MIVKRRNYPAHSAVSFFYVVVFMELCISRRLSKMVREGRLELPLCCQSWILSPVRLPIPPLSHQSGENRSFDPSIPSVYVHLDIVLKTSQIHADTDPVKIISNPVSVKKNWRKLLLCQYISHMFGIDCTEWRMVTPCLPQILPL